MPSLFVIRGNDQGTRFELQGPSISLGRDVANVVQLHDTEVSRQHADIRVQDGIFNLTDLNSSNGTFLNGKRVQRATLSSGDQVQIGGTLMLFTGPAEDAGEDLSGKIDISSPQTSGDESRIIRSVTHEEGSRMLRGDLESPQTTWLARARSNLQVMYRTALAVSHTLDIDQLLQRIMELVFEWVEADRGCVMLLDPDAKQLVPKVRRTRKGVRADEKITITKTILDYVMEQNEGVLTSDARQDDRWNPAASIVQMGVREAICVPMQGRYGVVGVIYIDTSTSAQDILRKGRSNKFTEDHLKLDDRHRPPGGPGRRGHPLLLRHGPGRATGGHRPDHRHPFPPHQEHPARHPRRQLPDRDGIDRSRRIGGSARAGPSSTRTRTRSPSSSWTCSPSARSASPTWWPRISTRSSPMWSS